ncbi:MAG: pitrilysin family protein, partial [Leptolyngbyaceae bacterium]|nr:pitrilysin family protein [Leptolyngbyaceae bacterium]
KNQIRGSIARRNDDPGSIAQREFNKLIYGADSPYARTAEYATLANITRDDVVSFHQDYFYPSNMLLSIYGDFEPTEMRSLIEQTFGAWQNPANTAASSPSPASLEPVTQQTSGGVFLVDQPQLTQSSILFGHLGGERDNPDYPELTVMNQVLNGLGGRLLNEVRSRQGLAYSVYAFWAASYDYPGIFIAGGDTRSDATVPFVESTIAELEAIQQTPITEAELAQAKDSVINSFVFNFQSPSQVLDRVVRYDFYDYPEDFIFQYRRDVEATTVEDVQRVAQEYLKPENLVILVVGNEEAIAPPLSQLPNGDEVITLDISIPEPDVALSGRS